MIFLRIKKNKKELFFRKRIIFVLIFLIFLFFLSRAFSGKIYRSYKTVFPTYTNYRKNLEVVGFNILDEKVYSAGDDGISLFNASEGQKVPVGFEIASINLMNDTSGLKDELIKVNAALNYKLNSSNNSENSISDFNVEKLQNDLKQNKFSSAIADINDIDLNSKDNISISELTELMKFTQEELAEKKQQLLLSISKSNIEYTSDFSGIVSYKIDGLESYYTIDNLEKINYAYLQKYNKVTKFESRSQVKKGDKLFKLINNLSYYLALKIEDNKKIDKFKVGDTLSLKFNFETLKGKIIKIEKENNKSVIILSMSDMFNSIYSDRINNFKIILVDKKCFEIPKSAIVKRNNLFGVYVQEIHGLVRFIPIIVISPTQDYSYVSKGDKNGYITIGDKSYRTISINDAIIVNPKQIDESQILN
ncbi:putative membrane fusion protein [Peptoniphilus sp. oral taxon 386 str. F0131]|nr:putative membrane fusion protein [Peptoniphilus sp. oral taxon 386 str. F0131]